MYCKMRASGCFELPQILCPSMFTCLRLYTHVLLSIIDLLTIEVLTRVCWLFRSLTRGCTHVIFIIITAVCMRGDSFRSPWNHRWFTPPSQLKLCPAQTKVNYYHNYYTFFFFWSVIKNVFGTQKVKALTFISIFTSTIFIHYNSCFLGKKKQEKKTTDAESANFISEKNNVL